MYVCQYARSEEEERIVRRYVIVMMNSSTDPFRKVEVMNATEVKLRSLSLGRRWWR